jgi:hypothetical protein
MNENLNKSQQRALQYWFIDGLAELSGGVICLLLAIAFFLWGIVPQSPLTDLIFFLILFGGGYLIRRVVLRLKERTTYPRTGYVAYKRGKQNKVAFYIAIGFTILLLALQVLLVLNGQQSLMWIPAIGGLIFAFIFSWTGYQTAMPRFYFLAVFCLLVGFGLAISGIGNMFGAALLSALTGLILIAFGGLDRWNYTHQKLHPTGETDEH